MFWIIVIVVLVLAVIVGVAQENERAEKKEQRGNEFRKKLNELEGFTVTKKIVGIENTYVLAVDEGKKKIVFIKEHQKKIIPFNQLISVEVMEDNIMLSQKSSLRTIGGAVVGGVLAGGAGTVVGGLSGDSKQNKKVSKVQVKIKLRDINNPSFTIDCFDCKTMTIKGEPVKPTSTLDGNIYKQGLNDAQKIADTLSVIIDATDRLEKRLSNSPKTSDVVKTGGIADELVKLAELKEKGILTEAEFNAQKKVLLNGSSTTIKEESKRADDEIVTEEDVVPEEIREAIEKGQFLVATKIYMEQTGCSLKEAKDYIDSIR